jgi:hypothetical protein
VTEAEVRRLVDLGVRVVRHGAGPFLETDVQKVRLATACERAGLPMDGIAAPIRADRLPFASLALLVDRSARQHGGVPVKWLGDGVMVHYREPAGAVLSALELVAQLPGAGLSPAPAGSW